MIYIENKTNYEKIRKYYVSFRQKQKELEDNDTFIYTEIPIYYAIKHNILLKDFMFHPNMIKYRKFYEESYMIKTKKEIADKIAEILQIELSNNLSESKISEVTLKKLIHVHKKLTKIKKYKNDTITEG